MATTRDPGDQVFLMARACIARMLVRDDVMGPEEALAETVWPRPRTLMVEAMVNRNTLASRAYSKRLNA